MLEIRDHISHLFTHMEKQIILSKKDKEELSISFKARRLLKRQYLLQADTVCAHESFVVKGCLRMFYVDEKGIDHTLSFAVENWWICDLESFLRGSPSAYNIEALENTIVLQVDAIALEKLYQKIPLLDRYFRILHQNAFIGQSKRILNNISLPGRARYDIFLKTYPQLHQRIPQKYIASFLGITPVFLSQIRKQRSQR